MKFILSILFVVSVGSGIAQTALLTTAEKSDFKATSTHQEVLNFISQLDKSYENISIETLSKTTEGREVPLMIIGNPLPGSAEDLINDPRLVVYFQANIHPGEVEGKEAIQMLARDLLEEMPDGIFDHVVLLLCPNLNPDGNEKFSKKNRTNQNGPENGVGVRHNGQFLDLNRDALKLETPEIRGVVENVFNRWDPAITVDCHTTNGSYHEEPVTFTWQMNPNGDRNLINFMRDEMMPEVHKTLLGKYKVENVFYGEFLDRMNVDTGWISYAAEPRYLVNYVGLRNRLGILNENYVYADFKTRVYGSYHLLKTILEYAAANKNEITSILEKADSVALKGNSEDSFAIKYIGKPTPEPVTIKAIEADTIPGMKGYWRYKQSDRKRTVTVPYIADYFATETTSIPNYYFLQVPDAAILENLHLHGVEIEQLSEDKELIIEKFKITGLSARQRLFQGHYLNAVEGDFVTDTLSFTKGTYYVSTNQPLKNVVTYLFEPQSDDGYLKWNFFDKYLVPQWGRGYYDYPVYKFNGRLDD